MSASDATPTTPDVTEMAAIHRVFRNAFTSAPGLIGGVADGDTARAAVVGSFFTNLLAFLHSHHLGEDELLFPRLIERAPADAEVERIAGQHVPVDVALTTVQATLSSWIASGSATTGAQLVADLADLEAVLVPHLDEEEREILPLVTTYITLEEWGELPGHAMQSFGGDNIFLIIGLVREQFNDEQRARMLGGMPPPAAAAWQAVGIESYKKSVAELVG